MQPQQGNNLVRIALPLHRKSHAAIRTHRQVTDRVEAQLLVQFHPVDQTTLPIQIGKVRPHLRNIQLAPVAWIGGDTAIRDRQQITGQAHHLMRSDPTGRDLADAAITLGH